MNYMFIGKKEAFQILLEIKNGKCKDSCRQVWLRNIQYALKTKTNPLELTPTERKRMTRKIQDIKSKSRKSCSKRGKNV